MHSVAAVGTREPRGDVGQRPTAGFYMFIIYNCERAADGRGRGVGGGQFHRLRVRVDGDMSSMVKTGEVRLSKWKAEL